MNRTSLTSSKLKNLGTSLTKFNKMRNTWVAVFTLLSVFVVGMLGVRYLSFSLAASAVLIVLIFLRTRLQSEQSTPIITNLKLHWVSFFLPLTLTLDLFSFRLFAFVLAFFIGLTFLQKDRLRIQLTVGPLVLLVASTVVSLQTLSPTKIATPILIFALVYRLVLTVENRVLITSVIHGYGLLLFANVVGYTFGLSSPRAAGRIGGLVESTGFSRVIFPFSESVNALPIIAAFVVVAVLTLREQASRMRYSLRLLWLVAAIIVLYKSGNRAALLILSFFLFLLISSLTLLQKISRSATVLAMSSSVVLPIIGTTAEQIIRPLTSLLAKGRNSVTSGSFNYEGRKIIWEGSIEFWQKWVTNPWHQLIGFGQNGSYKSGASITYSRFLESVVANPELSSVHNTFLQQLFDGGVLGVALLASATIWASYRTSNSISRSKPESTVLTASLAMLLFFGFTEHFIAPGSTSQPFWALAIFIGLACQGLDREIPPSEKHHDLQ